MTAVNCSRGSEWRQWDLHVHTPASFHWEGPHFVGNPQDAGNEVILDEMISSMNVSEPAVFSISDYWTFDGWFALKQRIAQSGAPALNKTVFPGIELRLVAPMDGRLNAHVIFSDTIDDQILNDFKSQLRVALIDRPLSESALMQFARTVGADKLSVHGFDKDVVDSDDSIALRAGSMMAEITCESYREAIENVPDGQAVGFMPFSTNDGLEQVKWQEHYAYVMQLFKSSPIFETRKYDLWAAFAGIKTDQNAAWLDNFQTALNNTPRLAVSGSDAHRFTGVAGDNNKRGYGDFPSGKATWIKADPTFRGLLHTIKEPAKRSFIGDIPEKLKNYRGNKSLFVDKLDISKNIGSTLKDVWLDETAVELNHDLVAVIGNKGSGKSALADVVALLGNSKQQKHFSFLKRFRGRNGDPAKQYTANLQWADASGLSRNLNDDPLPENVELVKYIPQGHFEELCNEHVSGNSMAFERELRGVIFSHVDDAIRLGSLDFDQLIDQQESTLRSSLEQIRSSLRKLNQKIAGIEEQLAPEIRKELLEKLELKRRQIVEHEINKPTEVEKPTGQLSEEQQKNAEELERLSKKIQDLQENRKKILEEETVLVTKQVAIKNIRDKALLLERQFREFEEEIQPDAEKLELEAKDIASLNLNIGIVDELELPIQERLLVIRKLLEEYTAEEAELVSQQKQLNEKLDAPQLVYQKYTEEQVSWKKKHEGLTGDSETPETFKGLEARIAQLDLLPEEREKLQSDRLVLTSDIFDVLDSQREAREKLFEPVQTLISSNALIRDDHRLRFVAELGCTTEKIAEELFSLIKQNSGEFRGEAESVNALRELVERYDFNDRSDVIKFVTELHDKIDEAARSSNKDRVGIGPLMRKSRDVKEVYDMIFSLEFLEPRYTLLFQDAHIEQLSPGQRGALLLIFYLLVDKGQSPIILDQPEENLDNETVVSLLVPVVNEAKERRQIIMVTHNPNLAVVCDAEQIIHCAFDRKNDSDIIYSSGSIENSETNTRVIDVLEGTMPAFNNRRVKYAVHT